MGKVSKNYMFQYLGLRFDFFNNIDSVKKDETGFTSNKYGIGIYAPNKDWELDCKIEAVIVFKKGYYD